MTNELKQSDSVIVPVKSANKGTSVPAEPMEERTGTKGNLRSQSMHRTQGRARMSQAAERIRQAATRKPKEKLTALLHHITTDALGVAYFSLKKDAAAGVDGMTWHEYGNGLEERLLDLHDRVHSGRYRALPSRRVEIPKPDGGTRPLGIAALEDKIVQSAVAETILVPIFEPEFLGFSYGFRPGRGAHDALDALAFGIERRKVNWIADADIRATRTACSTNTASTPPPTRRSISAENRGSRRSAAPSISRRNCGSNGECQFQSPASVDRRLKSPRKTKRETEEERDQWERASIPAQQLVLPAPPGARSAALLLTGKGGVSEAANLRSGILSGACGFSAFVELPGSWRGVRGAGGVPRHCGATRCLVRRCSRLPDRLVRGRASGVRPALPPSFPLGGGSGAGGASWVARVSASLQNLPNRCVAPPARARSPIPRTVVRRCPCRPLERR